jgi:tetratricopeptide (TPR) repeat protein
VKRSFFVPAAGLLLAGAAPAQTARALGKDDAHFARLLFRRGYPDLAEDFARLVKGKGKSNPRDLAEIRALELDLRLDKASREPEALKKADLIVELVGQMEEFVRTDPNGEDADEARDRLPELYRMLAEGMAAALQQESDPERLRKLREEGDDILTRAERSFNERRSALEEIRAEQPRAEGQYLGASFDRARTIFYHALFCAPEDPRRKDLLEKTIEAFQDFSIEWSDHLLNYHGLIFQGLAMKELGRSDEAIQVLDEAIRLRESYGRDARGLWDMAPDAADVVSAAVLHKVLVLTAKQDYAGVAATAKDFFETTRDFASTSQGLPVMGALAQAQLAAGDGKAAAATAQKLIGLDPQGPWGGLGSQLLSEALGKGGGGGVGPEQMLRLGERMVERGEYARAVQAARQLLAATRRTEKEANYGVEAFLLIGQAYASEGRLHEAALAFDVGAERFPAGEKAPDALWGAVNGYLELNAQERSPFYKKRLDDRMAQLARKYPKSPHAAYAQLVEARQAAAEKNYVKAAELYQLIPPGSPAYEQAEFGIGGCYFNQARRFAEERKPEEAKGYYERAESALRKTLADLDKALQKTLDRTAQAKLDALAFSARITLAQIYLADPIRRPAEALAILEGAEEKAGGDAEKSAQAWDLRIRALEAQGKIDEGARLLESLLEKNPDPRSLVGALRTLGRALDMRATEERKKDPRSGRPDELWRKAARYYFLSAQPMLSGSSRTSEIEEIANRLLVLGLHFSGVPEEETTFALPKPATVRKEGGDLLEQAARLYEAVLGLTPSYRTRISLGRAYGFLGRWPDAARVYGQLFDQEPLVEKGSKRLNPAVLAAKPELLSAYLEWGYAEHQTAAAHKETERERFERAQGIYGTICNSTTEEQRLWWVAKYFLIRCLIDAGNYVEADVALRSVERTTEDFDGGKFGFKDLFLELKEQLGTKVFRMQKPGSSEKKTRR